MKKLIKENNKLDWHNLPIEVIMLIKDVASEIGIDRLAIVGGAVRDGLLRQTQNYKSKKQNDIDLVLQGSAIKLAETLQRRLGLDRLPQLRLHNEYNTAEISLDGYLIDLASARVETYFALGENPHVQPAKLEEDLARRDFTVNSIALDLTSSCVLDPFNGRNALTNRQLEFIHSNSVAEDPTRIIRGARYASRLNFELSKTSLQQVRDTLKNWPWSWKHGEPSEKAPSALSTRLRQELELLIKKEQWEVGLTLLQRWGALLLLDQGLQSDKTWNRRLKWATRLGVDPLTAFIAGATDSLALAKRLRLPLHQQKLLSESLDLKKFISLRNRLDKDEKWLPSKWVHELEIAASFHPESVALTISLGIPKWKELLRWWGRWRMIESPISAKELIKNGWQEGPELGTELNRLRLEKIDKEYH